MQGIGSITERVLRLEDAARGQTEKGERETADVDQRIISQEQRELRQPPDNRGSPGQWCTVRREQDSRTDANKWDNG